MCNIEELKKKPIFQMTGEEFIELQRYASSIQHVPDANDKDPLVEDETEYVYGLSGICRLFNVGTTTAQRYKDTFLRPAVQQRGKKLIINKKMALSLFNAHR